MDAETVESQKSGSRKLKPEVFRHNACGYSRTTTLKYCTMNLQEIASRLVVLCRQGKFEQAQKELYSDDSTSTEPYATEAFQKGYPRFWRKGRNLRK